MRINNRGVEKARENTRGAYVGHEHFFKKVIEALIH